MHVWDLLSILKLYGDLASSLGGLQPFSLQHSLLHQPFPSPVVSGDTNVRFHGAVPESVLFFSDFFSVVQTFTFSVVQTFIDLQVH